MDESTALNKIAEYIRDIGYKAVVEDDYVRSSVGGLKTAVEWSAIGAIHLIVGMRKVPKSFDVAMANNYNREYRFASIFIDEEGAAVLQSDYLFDIEAPDAAEKLQFIYNLFENNVSVFRDLLIKATEVGARPESPKVRQPKARS